MPKPLPLRRGLVWQSEVTVKFNSLPMTSAFNIGSGGGAVPDVVVFSEYIPDRNHYHQLRFDDDISKFNVRFPFAMAMECKASYSDYYDIPKSQIDKCFDFLRYMSAVNRYVGLTFKFHTGRNSRQFMILFEYDDIYPNMTYSFFRCFNDGQYCFYEIPDGMLKSKRSEFANQVAKTKKVKLLSINTLTIATL
jgi:hypothetical protein